VNRLVSGLLTATLLLGTGCGQPAEFVAGSAQPSSGAGDAGFFFDGPVPMYGQRVQPADTVRLAYLRALRRIDVCGLVAQDTLARIGEIRSMATLFALDECDVEVKMPSAAERRFIGATVELARADGPEVTRADGLPVREAYAGSCEFLVPIDLAGLPGAAPLPGPDQPQLRIDLIGEDDCDTAGRVASVVAAQLARAPLPVRDGAAAYTTPLAERDPCEVLAVLDIGYWDIAAGQPYRCEFGVVDGRRLENRSPGPVPMNLALRPRVVDVSIEGRELVFVHDTEVYLDRAACTALAFVGPDLQRRLGNGDLTDTGDVVIRPAVDATSGEADCTGRTLVAEVAGRAAALYR
jgi:hypothetical protein